MLVHRFLISRNMLTLNSLLFGNVHHFTLVSSKENINMLRSTLCLLFTAVFIPAAFAKQGHMDVQSLQYEFGRGVGVHKPAVPVIAPVQRPIVCTPVVVCRPVCTTCRPCYKSRCYPAVPRRFLLRSAYYPPYYGYGYSPNVCGYRCCGSRCCGSRCYGCR